MEGKPEEKKGLIRKLKDGIEDQEAQIQILGCLLYTSPSPRDRTRSRMPSSA